MGILLEHMPVLPGLTTAPWASYSVTTAQSCSGAAPLIPAPLPRTSSPTNWAIFLSVILFRPGGRLVPFLDEEVPAWRQREAELGQCRGPGCNTLAPVLWAQTSWYHPKFQCKGLRVEKRVPEGRLFQNGGSFWQTGPVSVRDQTQVHWPGLCGATCATDKTQPAERHPPAKAEPCLRPANLQSRRLGWRSGPRETELPTGCGTRATLAILQAALWPAPPSSSWPWHLSPRQGMQTGGLSTTVSPTGREIPRGSGWHGRQAGIGGQAGASGGGRPHSPLSGSRRRSLPCARGQYCGSWPSVRT